MAALLALLAPAQSDAALRDAIDAAMPCAVDIGGVVTAPDGSRSGTAGSGILIHPAGYVLTNRHVAVAGELHAALYDGRVFRGRVVAMHPDEDLAVLKIDADGPLPAIRLGANEGLRVGEPAIVIGNPNGLSHTVTTGIVSRLAAGYVESGYVQTTAAVNGGNSGGPLLNGSGELIGVVTAKGGGEAIGLAIPVDRVRRVFAEMMVDEMERGWRLGLALDPVEARVAADGAGLRAGDVIERVGDVAVASAVDFWLVAADRPAGETLELTVRRGDGSTAVTLTPEPIPLREPVAGGSFEHGLRYEVYRGTWERLPDFSTLEPADRGFAASISHTVPGAGSDHVALRFLGYVEAPADGVYAFWTASDDGSRLWIGDALVVDSDGLHGAVDRRGRVRLKAGKHPLTVAWFERDGAEALRVDWSGPGFERRELPAESLFVD